jgi:hypothetical protein
MTLEDRVHAFRLDLFRRAQELGNVIAACRELGVSRSLFYQLRKRFERYGADGLRAVPVLGNRRVAGRGTYPGLPSEERHAEKHRRASQSRDHLRLGCFGRAVSEELLRFGTEVVVIESDPGKESDLTSAGIHSVIGSAVFTAPDPIT